VTVSFFPFFIFTFAKTTMITKYGILEALRFFSPRISLRDGVWRSRCITHRDSSSRTGSRKLTRQIEGDWKEKIPPVRQL